MSKLAKGLLGAFVLVTYACAVGGDESPLSQAPVDSVELAIVAPVALPGGMGPRLQKTCSATFPPGVERVLYGAAGAPRELTSPQRVIPAAAASRPALRVANGGIALEPAADRVGRVATARVAAQANGPDVLTSADGAMQITTTLRGAKAVAAQASDGLVVYPAGHADGDVVVRPRDDGAEDWVLLTRAPTGNAVEYDVALTSGVAAVRHVANTVEFLDAGGVPRLRMAPPSLVDADCKTVNVDVTVTGCTVDTDATSPYGKSHPAPGAPSCRVALSWASARVKYPVSLDPTWSGTGSMAVSRAFHTAQKLEAVSPALPEQVLVAGGITWPGGAVLTSAELYNVASGTWAATASMNVARHSFGSSRFANGEVFVAGGISWSGTPTTSTEIFTRSPTAAWTSKAALTTATAGQTVDVFADEWVYIAGGWTFNGWWSATNATAAYYRPNNSYGYTPPMAAGRGWHSSVVVNGEGIYLIGGERNVSTSSAPPITEVQRYTWGAANNITTVPYLLTARSKNDAVRYESKLFVAGGETASGPTAAAETLAVLPSASAWAATPAMASGRFHAKTAVRSTGPIVTGGYNGVGPTAETTIYDSFAVALAGPPMATPRYAHTATLLSNDRVLVAGGMSTTSASTNLTEILARETCTTVADCNDNNPCTENACDVTGRCTFVPKAPASDCDDGDKCNGRSTCSDAGLCVQTTAPPVECQACDAVTGNYSPKPANSACVFPSDACKGPGLCNGAGIGTGACVATAAAEGTPCGRTDVCDPLGIEACNHLGSCIPRPASAGLPASTDPCELAAGSTCASGLGIVRTRNPACGIRDLSPTPIDPSVPTSFAAATAFLTATGATTGQADVTIDANRRAVIRGRVTALDNMGAVTTPQVAVTIKDRPLFGTALSGDKGEYAIVVEGGGDLVVQFTLAGHITAERHAKTLWHEYTILDDVALVARATTSTVHQGASAVNYQPAWGDVRGLGAGGIGDMDKDAPRKGLLLFPPLVSSPDLPAGDFHVSITEVTAFTAGAAAMPASLPASSGYTYAMELAVAGHENARVNWSAPISYYVENFLGIADGQTVPVGFYDTGKSAWQATPSGRVISITGIAADGKATLAGIAYQGSGVTDDNAMISDAERVALADAYRLEVCGGTPSCSIGNGATAKGLWRVRLQHFTTYDCNWAGLAAGAGAPPEGKKPTPRPPVNACKIEKKGSIIECQNLVLGERVPIAGTPYSLEYRSSRTELANTTIDIPITDSRPFSPTFVEPLRIDVDIDVAGRRVRLVKSAPFTQDQTLTWTWDRKDAFGHYVEGAARATVSIRYVHRAILGATVDFGALATGAVVSGNRENRELSLDRTTVVTIGAPSAKPLGLGGWQLDAHGIYDPVARTFYKGDGNAVDTVTSAERVVGGGAASSVSPDGAPANGSTMQDPQAIAVAPDGTVYWGDSTTRGVRAVGASGLIESIGGTSCAAPWPASGLLSVPAADACIDIAGSVAIAPDGEVFAADRTYHRIIGIKNGVARLVAGRKSGVPGDVVDGQLAADGPLRDVGALTIDLEGRLLFAARARSSGNYWIMTVTPDGHVKRIAGLPDGTVACPAQDTALKATTICFGAIQGLAVDPSGRILVMDSTAKRMRAVGPDGVVSVLLGPGTNERGGFSALATKTHGYGNVGFFKGSIYYLDGTHAQLRAIRSDSRVDEIAGVFVGDLQTQIEQGLTTHPLRTGLGQAEAMAIGPAGEIYFAGNYAGVTPVRAHITKVADAFTSQVVDGSQLHELDFSGRHAATRSRLRQTVLRSFTYDADGALASVTDANNQTLAISYDGGTGHRVLVAPDGKTTTLAFDANGYLAKVTSPDGTERLITMDDKGQLTRFGKNGDGDPAKAHHFEYDARGLLTTDLSPDGEGVPQKLSASSDIPRRVVTHVTAQGRITKFVVDRAPTPASGQVGASEKRTNIVVTGTAGNTELSLSTEQEDFGSNGRVSTSPDGSRSRVTFGSDPKLGSAGQFATKTVSETMPTGGADNRTTTTVHTRTIAPDDSEQVDITTVNGAAWQSKFTRATWTNEKKTPLNRITTTVLDSAIDRVASMQVPPDPSVPVTLAGVTYAYVATPGPARGKVESITVGSRVVSFAYDANGYLQTTTAPDGKTLEVDTRDTMGRVTKMTLPGGRVVTQAYDAMGNVLSVVPPSLASHEMTYSPSGNLLASYIAPDLGGAAPRTTSYGYDRDGFLKTLISPKPPSPGPALNKTIVRDAAGRITSETEGGRTRTFTYWSDEADPTFVKGKGHLKESLATDGASSVKIAYAYKGSRLTAETQTIVGPARTLTRDHDSFLRPTTLGLTGHTGTLAYGYDADGLITSVGGLTASRGTSTGILKGISRPSKEGETFTYDQYGAPLTMLASYNGTSKGGLTLTFDSLSGRIVTKDENWSGFASLAHKTWTYTYDASGRLYTADDGSGPRVYEYDANGNLTGSMPDPQDRIVHTTLDGTVTDYTYDDHGNVVTRTVDAGPTQSLTWNGNGGLLQATKSGVTTKYLLDAKGRRSARLTDGTLNRTWTYDGQLRIVGEVITAVVPNPERVRLYGYLPGRHLPVMMSETISGVTKTYRIYGDHLGSLRAVVDSATGNVVQTMQHDPWGKILTGTDTVAGGFVRVPFGFAGGMYDEATGLVRFGAREYDSGSGRWLSKDEAQFGGGWNFYEYAASDPVNLFDRTGRQPAQVMADEAEQFVVGIGAAAMLGDLLGNIANAIQGALTPEPALGWAPPLAPGPRPPAPVAPPPSLAPPVACADNSAAEDADENEKWRAEIQSCQFFEKGSVARGSCCLEACGAQGRVLPADKAPCFSACSKAPQVETKPKPKATYR